MNRSKFNAGIVQLQIGEDLKSNTQKAVEAVREAATKGANVICLPEIYRSQYFCQKEDIDLYELAETIPGASTEAFTKVARETRTSVIVPIFEKRSLGVYHNSLVFINDSGEIGGIYRKMHIPDDPAYYEKFYFAPGDLGFKAFDTNYGKIGTLICWDQWYPEAARITAMLGASVIFYPTAIGWHPFEMEEHGKQQRDAWITVQRGHAVANGVYVIAVNRVGFEQPVKEQEGILFWGSSFVADPQGVIIAEAPTDKEAVLIAEIDPERIEYIRRNWPFFRDRRIDAYSDITKRFLEN
ncbi:MAG: carbon-nitrogen hydrolase [Ignavibacteriales bacterium]|nr:MAG: carbon-nitrogen hydrolase [Ignavibacteriaceae bacterium]MBW7872740.1 carbon-nitrogen hydrolase [Ignavibacteria bacterium]MCZ2143460.1 carbon-nitrogen hydrolase [Ignavibacteriales bacterium]OQY75056.1 MAG: acyltransferase [Ignavibacteriales bacterium UTCHB3]MBV6444337.1 N-carbamoyl-D-amino acid hydrolase [Ignavibacteriaceae bacterium]